MNSETESSEKNAAGHSTTKFTCYFCKPSFSDMDYADKKVWREKIEADLMDSLSNTKRYTSFLNLKMITTMMTMMMNDDNIKYDDDDEDRSSAQYDGQAFKK